MPVIADIPEGEDWKAYLNPNSLEVVSNAKLERSLAMSPLGYRCQFERLGYFCTDAKDSKPDHLVFNRTVTLKDTLAKIEKRGG